MFILNGQELRDVGFSVGEGDDLITYPPHWLSLATADELESIGVSVEPDLAPPTPVISVSPWQIRKALNQLELRDAVEQAVAAGDWTTQDAWQYATEFVRTDPLVVAIGYGLGKSDAELDALFELAAAL